MNKVIGYIAHQVAKGIPLTASFTWFVFWGDPKYRDPHMCHKWGYTEEQLVKLMREVGFRDVRCEEPRYHFKQRDMRVVGVK